MKFVYSPDYYADIGFHVFPVEKYRLVYERLCEERGIEPSDFMTPEPATRAQLGLVHTAEYLDDLENCRWTARTSASELPISPEIVLLFRLAAGGSILAAETAIRERAAVHLLGGFHHAFADRAEGFCYLNDLAVAARVAQRARPGLKVAILDCDLHQGNGTAGIFADDESVFTFSIHQRDLYPVKVPGDRDIELENGVGDSEYLDRLESAIPGILDGFRPDLALYQAGADPYAGDQLGSLALSIEGLYRRDELVMSHCRKRGVPLAATLGGGYASDTADTVRIHVGTALAARRVCL